MVGSREHHFELSFGLGNAEFDGVEERKAGIARLLRETADKVERGHDDEFLYDVNGNKVGHWCYDPHQDAPDDLGFVDSMETRPTDMRRSIHQSHRGEGSNFVD